MEPRTTTIVRNSKLSANNSPRPAGEGKGEGESLEVELTQEELKRHHHRNSDPHPSPNLKFPSKIQLNLYRHFTQKIVSK
jgi:hypothetical protein